MSDEAAASGDRLDVLGEDVRDLQGAVTEVMEELERLDGVLLRIEDAVAGLPGQGATPGTPSEDGDAPVAWTAVADAAEWAELAAWVDGLVLTYELADRIAPCWPAHLGVVEELAALWLSWKAAAVTEARVTGSLAFWHDRYLVGTVARVDSGFYPIRHCRDGHRNPDHPRLTDRTQLEGRGTDRSADGTVIEAPDPASDSAGDSAESLSPFPTMRGDSAESPRCADGSMS